MIYIENNKTHPRDKRYYRILIPNLSSTYHSLLLKPSINFIATHLLPSKSLCHWYSTLSEKRFPDFRLQYIAELNENPNTVKLIKSLAKASASDFIILYDTKLNYRTAQALRDYLRIMMGQPPVKSSSLINRSLAILYNDNEGAYTVKLPKVCALLKDNIEFLQKYHLAIQNNHIIYKKKRLRHHQLISMLLKLSKKSN